MRDYLTELADRQAARAAEPLVIWLPLSLDQIPPDPATGLLPRKERSDDEERA